MKIAFLFTCYNRIEKTTRCIKSIFSALAEIENVEDTWYITDAGSTDGTVDRIKELIDESKMHIRVEENAFYSQGMRVCMQMARKQSDCDYYFIINDDVAFYDDFLVKMLQQAAEGYSFVGAGNKNVQVGSLVIVGATDDANAQTYGGVRYTNGFPKRNHFIIRSIRYKMVGIEDANRTCHTFNANCVMIPRKVFETVDIMDSKYVHGLGDFDYGMCISEEFNMNYEEISSAIITTDFYVGNCSNNARSDTWMDSSLSRRERFARLNSIKGAPTKQWFYYLYKHFGAMTAIVHSATPYIRILLGR